VDASGRLAPFEQSINLAYFRQITEQFGLADASALIYDNGAEIYGLSYAELLEIADQAVLLVNISGHLRITPLLDRLRRKLYLDLDPGYTQFWHALGYRNLGLDGHDWYYTVGENIGT